MFEDKKILAMLDEVVHLLHESIRLQFRILKHFNLQDIVGFTISQQGDENMALLPIAPWVLPSFHRNPRTGWNIPCAGKHSYMGKLRHGQRANYG